MAGMIEQKREEGEVYSELVASVDIVVDRQRVNFAVRKPINRRQRIKYLETSVRDGSVW